MAKKNHKKISLKHLGGTFFKSRTFFIILALAFLLALGFATISNLLFLGRQLNNALNVNVNTDSALKFDTAGFEKLKLIR